MVCASASTATAQRLSGTIDKRESRLRRGTSTNTMDTFFCPRCQTHTPDANRAFTEQPDQSSFVPCTSQACGFRNSGSRPKLVWPQVHRKKWHTRTQQTVTAAAGLCWQIEPASCVATEYGTSPCLFSAEFFLCVKKTSMRQWRT